MQNPARISGEKPSWMPFRCLHFAFGKRKQSCDPHTNYIVNEKGRDWFFVGRRTSCVRYQPSTQHHKCLLTESKLPLASLEWSSNYFIPSVIAFNDEITVYIIFGREAAANRRVSYREVCPRWDDSDLPPSRPDAIVLPAWRPQVCRPCP